MTLMEAINHLDAVKPNSYGQREKIKWLSNLDGLIKKEIIETHEHDVELIENKSTGKVDLVAFDMVIDSFSINEKGEYVSKKGTTYANKQAVIAYGKGVKYPYSEYTEADLTKKLIASAPYDDIYIKWLEAKIDFANGEYQKYNNSALAFNEGYQRFARFYHREHRPKNTAEFTNF